MFWLLNRDFPEVPLEHFLRSDSLCSELPLGDPLLSCISKMAPLREALRLPETMHFATTHLGV